MVGEQRTIFLANADAKNQREYTEQFVLLFIISFLIVENHYLVRVECVRGADGLQKCCRSAASTTLLVGGIVLDFETMLATLINQPPTTTFFNFTLTLKER